MTRTRGWLWLALLLSPTAMAAELAIVGARVVTAPDAVPIERGTVLVRDGRIARVGDAAEIDVPEGASVVDGAGRTLVAGFWNSHVHFLTPETRTPRETPAATLQQALDGMLTRWGFTTVFDIASFDGAAQALRERIAAGEVDGPEILSTGMPFFPEHGTPSYVRDLLEELGVPSSEVASAAEGRARAQRQLADGADGVKLFAGAIVGGETGVLPMPADIARAVVDAAHDAGKPAFAHPTDLAGLEVAIASGTDVLAHGTPVSGPWDAALVARLRREDIALVPTMTLFEVELRRENAPDAVRERLLAASAQQVRALHDAGGDILFGTDIGYIDEADTRREFELLAQAGLDWREILATLTTTPAKRFGQSERKGRIAPGLQADLVLLSADPADDVRAFADVVQVFRNGALIHDEAAPRATPR